MSKKETATIYRCEHCVKYYSISNGAANYHEKRCSKNPKNQHACFGCKFLKFGSSSHEFGEGGVKVLMCTAQDDKIIHSNKTAEKVRRNMPFRKPLGELMPYKCDLYIMKQDF